jgi:hypothetical protein
MAQKFAPAMTIVAEVNANLSSPIGPPEELKKLVSGHDGLY